MKTLFCFFLALLAGAAFGQQQQIAPDCDIPFTFTASGQRSSIIGCGRNTQGVTDWRITYLANGSSGIMLEVDSAADAAGHPGTWGAFGGTVAEGINPNTATVGASSRFEGFYPWMSVTLASASTAGTIVGHLYGCRTPGCSAVVPTAGSGSGCVGTTPTPCIVAGPDSPITPPSQYPVLVAGWDLTNVQILQTDVNGRLLQGAYTLSAPISFSAVSGRQVILSNAGSGTSATIAHLSISFATAVTTLQFIFGHGTACLTGLSDISGPYANVATIALDVPFIVPAGADLCASLGSTVTGGGLLIYEQP